MRHYAEEWKHASVGIVKFGEPLAEYTTWKIGGPADMLIMPNTTEELARAVQLLQRQGLPWMNLGRGSNLLVGDGGFRGAIIKPGAGFDYARFDGNLVYAGASFSFIKLSVMAGKHGLTGLEYAGGIPGSVGGAVYMNAGAHGSDVSRIFKSAQIVWDTGELAELDAWQMQFDYRHSVLHERRGVIAGAVFQLEPGDRKEIAAAMASYKDRRLRTQPLKQPTAGSVFRNPDGDHSARLIEAAGLKGLRIGGAEVSQQHANFIVNTGQATADDVLALMERIQSVVQDRFGIVLEPEVRVVGER
ncbi:UDP-N-acetylmuramate dehydrogenase [Paenibacillus sp. IB182496]|uniref:UDP-N-acetylenolpyruvoylglucosamine reductase n=1 Tax=Paenibacillus sabuli TaxID=2772509 RepID=A0A927GS83_9BACL|nr:UDP-N-acetylmuramate dehydrogenase [Paenibacillus sabuli]MBD2846288.1 UDP-N-acetylmuramate dehydrogenase [Paenibacillus sabuli]